MQTRSKWAVADYPDHFHKGWADVDSWVDFQNAVMAGDSHLIKSAVRDQRAKYPNDTYRLPVDAFAYTQRLQRAAQESVLNHPLDPDDNMDRQYAFVRQIQGLRDVKFARLPNDLPLGLRRVAIWLQKEVIAYRTEVDYMTTPEQYERVQKGLVPFQHTVATSARGTCRTIRDLATYVHSDAPMHLWQQCVRDLHRRGCPRNEISGMQTEGLQDSVACGLPWVEALFGKVFLAAACAVFQQKRFFSIVRPEYYAQHVKGEFLSQAYPEGSPMHPAFPAGHSYFAHVFAATVLRLYDGNFRIGDGPGMKVKEQVELMADNIGYGRVGAGVHYPMDHEACKKQAYALVELVLQDELSNDKPGALSVSAL